jgi:hypothetical protein
MIGGWQDPHDRSHPCGRIHPQSQRDVRAPTARRPEVGNAASASSSRAGVKPPALDSWAPAINAAPAGGLSSVRCSSAADLARHSTVSWAMGNSTAGLLWRKRPASPRRHESNGGFRRLRA